MNTPDDSGSPVAITNSGGEAGGGWELEL